jgi:hypothetical protein
MINLIIKCVDLCKDRLLAHLLELGISTQLCYFIIAEILLVIVALTILAVRELVYKLLFLGVLSLLVVFT